MKIKSDFVTNSSSTVFVLIARSQLTRAGIQELIGTREGSPLKPVADVLYDLLEQSGKHMRTPSAAAEELAKQDFKESLTGRVESAMAEGHEVRIGWLSSDSDDIEAFLCCDCFEAENDAYYLNALRCVW